LNDLLQDKTINYLHSLEDSKLYIGTTKGILYVDLETQESKEYPIPDNIKKDVFKFNVRCIYTDRHKRIWVGTAVGLFVIEPETGEYIRFVHDSSDLTSLSDNSINAILHDKHGYIWIATYKGLNRFKAEGLGFKGIETIKFERILADDKHLLSNRIIALEEINDKLFLDKPKMEIYGLVRKKAFFILTRQQETLILLVIKMA